MRLQDLNRTELHLLAQEIDPNVSKQLEHEDLIAVIEGELPEQPERYVDKIRLTIMRYVNKHWEQLAPMVSCPAKTQNPRACFQCTDIQVVECALKNQNTIFEKD